jgi:hypothetical protein
MRPGFHFVRWSEDWHALDDLTLRGAGGRLTLCRLAMPDVRRKRTALVSFDPERLADHNGTLPKPLCDECGCWIGIARRRGTRAMYRRMGD